MDGISGEIIDPQRENVIKVFKLIYRMNDDKWVEVFIQHNHFWFANFAWCSFATPIFLCKKTGSFNFVTKEHLNSFLCQINSKVHMVVLIKEAKYYLKLLWLTQIRQFRL